MTSKSENLRVASTYSAIDTCAAGKQPRTALYITQSPIPPLEFDGITTFTKLPNPTTGQAPKDEGSKLAIVFFLIMLIMSICGWLAHKTPVAYQSYTVVPRADYSLLSWEDKSWQRLTNVGFVTIENTITMSVSNGSQH